MNVSTSEVTPQARVLTWTARASAVVLVMALFASYASANIDVGPLIWLKRLFFPIGVVLGYLLALRWPQQGGLLALGSLAVILGWLGIAGNFNGVLLLLPYSIPGFLFIAVGALSKAGNTQGGA